MSVNNIFLFVLLATFFSCRDKKTERQLNALESAREFIQATRSGDFKTAERFLLNDPENFQSFEQYKKQYTDLPAKNKIDVSNSSYVINNIDELNDSTVLINYSNGYSKKPTEIKIVRKNKIWQVDLKTQ